MSFKVTAHLKGLTPREAIADAFYRLFAAFDENDAELLDSALDPDVVVIVNGKEANGLEGIEEGPFKTMGPMDTTHHISNLRIDVEDMNATTATLTANSLAQHYPAGTGSTPGDRRLLGGGKSLAKLAKQEDGSWRITEWNMKLVWTEGDFSVLGPHP